MGKTVAIVQSNYIPWKGYFDLIHRSDEFILLDSVQYTRRDWRNRNRIKTPQGLRWLTIPVRVKGKYLQKINETEVSDPGWGRKHWRTLARNYAGAKCFDEYRRLFEELYLGASERLLSRISYRFVRAICEVLGITTKISWCTDYRPDDGRTQRLVDLCRQTGATEYLSGPTAKGYLDEGLFEDAGISVSWMDYSDYPEYEQLFGPFEHKVSIIDLLFNTGADAPKYMKSFQCRHAVEGV